MWGPTPAGPGSQREEAEEVVDALEVAAGEGAAAGGGEDRGGGGEAAAAAGEAHGSVLCFVTHVTPR